MKKFKLLLFFLIVIFLGLVGYQNQGFFMAKSPLDINLFFQKYYVPSLPYVFYFGLFFLVGLLLAYISGFSKRLKDKKTIKELNNSLDSHLATLSNLKQELDTLKGPAANDETIVLEQPDTTQEEPAESEKTIN